MKSLFIFTLLLAPFILQKDPFEQFHILRGEWRAAGKHGFIYEKWETTSEDEMRSRSYRLLGNDTLILEEVRVLRLPGGLFYVPIVNDQNQGQPVSFKMVSSDNRMFVFENKQHDFPQRVIYHIITPDSVHAWIEGSRNGKSERTDYFFKRTIE